MANVTPDSGLMGAQVNRTGAVRGFRTRRGGCIDVAVAGRCRGAAGPGSARLTRPHAQPAGHRARPASRRAPWSSAAALRCGGDFRRRTSSAAIVDVRAATYRVRSNDPTRCPAAGQAAHRPGHGCRRQLDGDAQVRSRMGEHEHRTASPVAAAGAASSLLHVPRVARCSACARAAWHAAGAGRVRRAADSLERQRHHDRVGVVARLQRPAAAGTRP
ncbi:MAG: hypothetical protein MZV70_33785 [Desulfobacterales bacterium]|nr:hypothetical protein [Desulfobacterales bacterium]